MACFDPCWLWDDSISRGLSELTGSLHSNLFGCGCNKSCGGCAGGCNGCGGC